MHVYGHMDDQAHICPDKCHEDKPLRISLEIIGTKYDSAQLPPEIGRFCVRASIPRCTTYTVDPNPVRVHNTRDVFDLVWYF